MVRLATFNLLHGRSVHDGAVDVRALRAAAAELDADIVGLQEVDRAQPRSSGADQTAVVAEALTAPHWRFVAALLGTPGGTWTAATGDGSTTADGPAYGIGLVSRHPVQSWHVRRFRPAPVGLPLLVPGPERSFAHVDDEPRVAVAAVVSTDRGPVTVLTTHLSFVPGWNIAQLRALSAWARTLPGPSILLGDLNLPGRVPGWASRWTQAVRLPTYPSWRARVQLDHVLLDGVPRSAVTQVRVVRTAVSDHCALVVDLDLAATS